MSALEQAVIARLGDWTRDRDLYAAFVHLHWSQVHRVVLRLRNQGRVIARAAGTQLRAVREGAACN